MHCINCSEKENKLNIVRFAAVAFIPLTVFYAIVVLFKFNANSPVMHGFILYAQLISAPFVVRVLIAVLDSQNIAGIKVVATLYGIWNLDSFRTLYPDMCLKLTTLQVIALDYVIAFYPLLLMLFTMIAFKLYSRHYRIMHLLWYPFAVCLKKEWNERASMIDVFTTFLLLSYGRIMSVSTNLRFSINCEID